MRNACKILTICVNYRNDEETAYFVKQLLEQHCAGSLRIIIADNSERTSISEELEVIAARDERISVVSTGENLGYLGGAAFALEVYTRQHGIPLWTIVCNTDIDFVQPDFFVKLCAYHD